MSFNLPVNHPLGELGESLKTQGFLTIEGVFSDREMNQFRAYLDRIVEEALEVEIYKGRPTDQLIGKVNDTVWTYGDVYGVCPDALRYSRHPVILKILESVLGERVTHASQGTMFDKLAGGGAQIGWHQDTFFTLDPIDWNDIDVNDYKDQFGHVQVWPNQMEMIEDYFLRSIIVRINIDEQTVENGVMQVLAGSHLQGPFELKDNPDQARADYVEAHGSDVVHCTASVGSVTFYYPTTLHRSDPSKALLGTHRRAVAHRMRACSLNIPGWNWPTDFEPGVIPATPASGFDMNPTL